MIDIKMVQKLEEEALALRILREQEKQESALRTYEETRKRNIVFVEKAKKLAEKALPKMLAKFEEDVKIAIRNGIRSITVRCDIATDDDINPFIIMQVQILIMGILSLEGFICKYSSDNRNVLIVSW